MSPGPSHPDVQSDSRSRGAPGPRAPDRGHREQPGTAGAPEPEPEPGPAVPPCYVATAQADGSCERRPVSAAGQLRSEISKLVGGPAASCSQPVAAGAGGARPLISVYGLPAALVPVLLGSPLGIDPAFVEAHAAGRRYRPPGVRRRREPAAAAVYAHWEYPELVAGCWEAVARAKPREVLEGRRPVVQPVSEAGKGLAVVFCRASLWVSQDVDVLFLDKPCWGGRGPLRKARRAIDLRGYDPPVRQEPQLKDDGTRGNVAAGRWGGEEIPSLDITLQDGLATTGVDGGVIQLLQDTAYEQWLELFEVLTPGRRVRRPEGTSLEWQMMQALERNFDVARYISRCRNASEAERSPAVGPDDWGGLTQRLRTRVEILTAMSPCAAAHDKTASGAPFGQERLAYIPRSRPGADGGGGDDDDNNQRAMDRVTYLGGVLLPFSLVSGVLSMNEGFEPGQPLFWVFWVAAVPLVLLTLLAIYADKLRQVEVWAEVLDPGAGGGGDPPDGGDDGDGAGAWKPTSWLGVPMYDRRRRRQRGPVTYSVGGDVVIDLGSPAAGIQQVAAGSLGTSGDDQPSDCEQHEESSLSDEHTAGGAVLQAAPGDAGYRPGWRKKQLGWKGAAMCILRIKKPLRVLDGMPIAAREGERDD